MREMPRDQLADFLNDATGLGGGRKISPELEQAIVADFSNDITKTDGAYRYVGQPFVDKYNQFSSSYAASQEQYARVETTINSANQVGIKKTAGQFASQEAQGVLQHDIAITNSQSEKPVLGTYGAGPCIIVAAYNFSTQQGFLSHVDSLTETPCLRQYLQRISGNQSDEIQVHLHGGDNSSREQAAGIVDFLRSQPNIKIVSANLCEGLESKSLALDTRTGEIFTDFAPSQLETGKDDEIKIRMLAMNTRESPLNLSFDGERIPTTGKHTQAPEPPLKGPDLPPNRQVRK